MKTLIRAIVSGLFFLAMGTAAIAQGTLPFALSQTVDSNGRPMAGAYCTLYLTGTVAQPQLTFQDTALLMPNSIAISRAQASRSRP